MIDSVKKNTFLFASLDISLRSVWLRGWKSLAAITQSHKTKINFKLNSLGFAIKEHVAFIEHFFYIKSLSYLTLNRAKFLLINLQICPTKAHINTYSQEKTHKKLHPKFTHTQLGKHHTHTISNGALVANPDFKDVMTSHQHLAKDAKNIWPHKTA